MKYDILATGSSGNCTIIEECIAIDLGVSFKKLAPYYRDLKLVLLTHQHSDHFNKRTIARLAKERPMLFWGCCEWLVAPLVECGVQKQNIHVYEFDKLYGYTLSNGNDYSEITMISSFPLFHDVPNCGYKIAISRDEIGAVATLLYATDTNKILTEAKNYDLYLIEANYDDDEIQERIDRQILESDKVDPFIHEYKARENHLSYQSAMDFIAANQGPKSRYQLLHQHKEE